MKFESLQDLGIDMDGISKKVRTAIAKLFNLIEELAADNRELRSENQRLRDENNQLKGEQKKPKIKGKNKRESKDISSEKERKGQVKKGKKRRGSKKDKIKINRAEVCPVEPEVLPRDAEFKGYDKVTVQDLIIQTDNVEFWKEIYYSAGLSKTFRGQLPPGYEGEYGPTVKALTIVWKQLANVSESKIVMMFENMGIKISEATVSRMATKNKEEFHQEKADIYQAGLKSTTYQQTDHTSARVNGENWNTQVMCNPYYSAFFTRPKKDRLTVLDIICGGRSAEEREYIFNEETFSIMEQLRLSQRVRDKLQIVPQGLILSEVEIENLLNGRFDNLGPQQRIRILESAAIAAYHQQRDGPIIQVLISDDAPQFKLITEELGLCWVHDGRHYKKLSPIIPHHQQLLKKFRKRYWEYYYLLLEYKQQPCQEKAKELEKKFDQLFSTKTGYADLDERIAKSKAKKTELLLVLKYPEIPLHNNASELAARAQVRKRDVSLQTRSVEGTQVQDTFLTIIETAKKLGINAYEYLFDRISQTYAMMSLADIIRQRSLAANHLAYPGICR